MNQLIKIIKDLIARKGWYKLTIQIQGGKIAHIFSEESIKPE